MAKYLKKEEMSNILATIVGDGAVKIYVQNQNKNYEKGDVMIYKNGNITSLFKCKVAGTYGIPSETAFKKINLRGR